MLILGSSCGEKTPVEAVQPTLGPLQVSFQERAKTRLAKDYPVALPVSGRIGRLDLEPGDAVERGQVLTTFDAFSVKNKEQLDLATIQQLQTRLTNSRDLSIEKAERVAAVRGVTAARAQVGTLKAQLLTARREAQQAQVDLRRTQTLVDSGALPEQQLERDRLRRDQAALQIRQLQRQIQQAQAEVARAQASVTAVDRRMQTKLRQSQEVEAEIARSRVALSQSQYDVNRTSITAPIDGLVLERMVQGPIELPAGSVLVRLGKREDLEGVSEVLSQDALKLQLGDRVELDPGGQVESIKATVREIEPTGFTKLSSLGVEQQRVLVLLELENQPPALGIGFEMQARFIVDEKSEALKIPRFSVLQDEQGQRYVFKIAGSTISKQVIQIGLEGDTEFEVLDGLTQQDKLVRTPDTQLQDGQQVEIK